VRIFKNAWFAQFARKQRIADKALVDAVHRAERGLIDANLGGGVVKQRIARSGQGKSSGYRVIILYLRNERAFFVYGFAKNDRDNIDKRKRPISRLWPDMYWSFRSSICPRRWREEYSWRFVMTKSYRSEAFAAIHQTMEGLHEIGAVDKQTMREFDEACLTAVHPLSPEEIRAIREREHISQPVFARYLNVSKNMVSDWERGVKKPGGPALRLLTIVQKRGLQAIA